MSFSNNAIGSAISTIGGALNSAGQANAARQQAAVDDENARRSIQAGEQEVSTVNRHAREAMGTQIANMAGSGFVPNAGSAADLITASSLDAARDVANIRTKASYQAANYENDAQAKREAAHAAIINGLFGNVANALNANNKARNQRLIDTANVNNRQASLGSSIITTLPDITKAIPESFTPLEMN